MFVSIPKQLDPFVQPSLREGEAEKWLRWYNVLNTEDKRNILELLPGLYRWWKDPSLSKGFDEFGVLYSIGSTARKALGDDIGEYSDIDLLYVTNCPSGCFSYINYLQQKFSSDFASSIDQDPSKIYLNGRVDRIKVDLEPKKRGSSIDLVIQPGIDTDAFWEKFDDKPKVVLLRWTKNTEGRYGQPMPLHY